MSTAAVQQQQTTKVKDVSKGLGVSDKYIYRMCNDGRLQAMKVPTSRGHQLEVTNNSIKIFLLSHQGRFIKEKADRNFMIGL